MEHLGDNLEGHRSALLSPTPSSTAHTPAQVGVAPAPGTALERLADPDLLREYCCGQEMLATCWAGVRGDPAAHAAQSLLDPSLAPLKQ